MSSSSILDLRFVIRKDKAKENFAPLYARISITGDKPADISLKRDVDINNWNMKTEKVIGKTPEDRAFNSYLSQVRTSLDNIFAQLKFQHGDVTAEQVKNCYTGKGQKERTLVELVDYHNNHLKHTIEEGTLKNYRTTKLYLEEFVKRNFGVSDIRLSKLSYTFLVDFKIFLKERQPEGRQKPCGHNTVLKHVERLRKMVNEAIKNEWLEKDPFEKHQARFIHTDRDFLIEEEIERLENLQLDSPRLSYVRDLFVFSIYTGLAYADVMALAPQNVTLGIDGEYWVTTSRKKSHQSVRFPILPKAMEILQKYADDPRAQSIGKCFPKISNQKVNAYLKEIAALCGIAKNLTFHLARHTFATTIALSNGVPIETVSKILGHSTIRMTQIYAKVLAKKISEDMSALRMKLSVKPKNTQPSSQLKVG